MSSQDPAIQEAVAAYQAFIEETGDDIVDVESPPRPKSPNQKLKKSGKSKPPSTSTTPNFTPTEPGSSAAAAAARLFSTSSKTTSTSGSGDALTGDWDHHPHDDELDVADGDDDDDDALENENWQDEPEQEQLGTATSLVPRTSSSWSRVPAQKTVTGLSAETEASVLRRIPGVGFKAGMAGLDKAASVVLEVSRGSRFFANEAKKDAKTNAKIQEMVDKARKMSEKAMKAAETAACATMEKLEAQRDLTRTIVVVDMDAFYVSVVIRDRPELRGKPVATGGSAMLSTASYEARKFGIRSAMPGYIAKKLCPDIIIVPTPMEAVSAAAAAARGVFASFDPNYKSYSLDEATMDITDWLAAHPGVTPEQATARMRAEVTEATNGLTCSAGIGPNKMIAKIASDMNKPNGQTLIESTRESVLEFLDPLSVRKIPGIGKVTEKKLEALEIKTVADLRSPRGSALVHALFLPKTSGFFFRVMLGMQTSFSSFGMGDENSEAAEAAKSASRKSIGAERTFFPPRREISDIEPIVHKICSRVSQTMVEKDLKAGSMTVKLKSANFAVSSRAVSLRGFTNDAQKMADATMRVLSLELPKTGALRLIGIRMTKFEEKTQATLKTKGSNKFKAPSKKPVPAKALPRGPPRPLPKASRPLPLPAPPQNSAMLDVLPVENGVVSELAVERIGDPNSSTSSASTSTNGTDGFSWEKEGLFRYTVPREQLPDPIKKEPAKDKEPANPTAAVGLGRLDRFECPVCGIVMTDVWTTKANFHVDACLGGQAMGKGQDHPPSSGGGGGAVKHRMGTLMDFGLGASNPGRKGLKRSASSHAPVSRYTKKGRR